MSEKTERIVEKIRGLDDGFPDTTDEVDIAIRWVKENEFTTCQAAWDACTRADWMMRYLCHYRWDDLNPKIRLAACACARTALRYVPKGEDRPLKAIEAAEGFVRGEVAEGEMEAAGRNAQIFADRIHAVARNKFRGWPSEHTVAWAAEAAVATTSKDSGIECAIEYAAYAKWGFGHAISNALTGTVGAYLLDAPDSPLVRAIESDTREGMADIIRLLIPKL